MPGLLTGDRLVVTKYPYGWSLVSPSFHLVPPMEGRLFGKLTEGGRLTVDLDDKDEVLLDIQPLPKKEGKAKPEPEEISSD